MPVTQSIYRIFSTPDVLTPGLEWAGLLPTHHQDRQLNNFTICMRYEVPAKNLHIKGTVQRDGGGAVTLKGFHMLGGGLNSPRLPL
jgi:hypothetical protein